ncbi:MAG TPA: molybdopterin-dependent oxidoreductase [Myxococcaceae bacterium]|nr:molybdopterin-dependent oxidoreductase [Myxococcaceae bacterium]
MRTRRQFLVDLAGGAAMLGAGGLGPSLARAGDAQSVGPATLPAGTLENSFLEALPGKRPLIKRTYRPPNFETPLDVFDQVFTPNDAFFVRYHLPQIPQVPAKEWKLEIGGDAAEKPFTLDLPGLQRDFEQVELAAVCQCSGNRRGLSDPHVAGVEWGIGAMGNARWKGVRLKDVLARAAPRKDALEVISNGADHGSLEATPDFIKSIPMWKAMDENTLLAWQMNGEPLPHFNGAPVRMIVPGWTATYWMKHIVSIQVSAQPCKNFWMATAYRMPKGKFPVVDRFLSQETDVNTPITDMVVNSLLTSPRQGQQFRPGVPVEVKGIAWDNGSGIRTVEVSADGGRSWETATLDQDVGRYAFRGFRHAVKAASGGEMTVMAKATNRMGASQAFELVFNPAGYHNNVVSRVSVRVG